MEITEKDKQFLKVLKSQGVPAQEAYDRLQKVKGSSGGATSSPSHVNDIPSPTDIPQIKSFLQNSGYQSPGSQFAKPWEYTANDFNSSLAGQFVQKQAPQLDQAMKDEANSGVNIFDRAGKALGQAAGGVYDVGAGVLGMAGNAISQAGKVPGAMIDLATGNYRKDASGKPDMTITPEDQKKIEDSQAGIKGLNQAVGGIGKAVSSPLAASPVIQKAASLPFEAVHDVISSALKDGGVDTESESGKTIVDSLLNGLSMAAIGPKNITKGITGALDAGMKVSDFFGEKTGIKDLNSKNIDTLRSEKMAKGLKEQNTRLKSVNKAFEDNTKTYTSEDGQIKKVTPIDTLSKHNIVPQIENGSIQMGDYKQGTGALGELKGKVENLDAEIDTVLKNTGAKINLDDLWQEAVEKAKSNPDIKQSGAVESTIAKIDKRFGDYVNSYGNTVDIAELNNIRKTANKDWSPETQDVSRIVGDVARDKVYHATDDMQVKNLLKDQSELLAAKKYAEKLNGTKVVGGRIGNYAASTAGAIIGSTVNNAPILGPIVGMLGGEYIARALQQSQFKSPLIEAKAILSKGKK